MKDTVSQCPIEDAMTLLSGRWPTLLLYYLQDGPKRFNQLRRDNPSISHRMLSHHLKRLHDAGIVCRLAGDGYPLHVEYRLTDDGLRLVPLIDAIGDWWQQRGSRKGADTAPR